MVFTLERRHVSTRRVTFVGVRNTVVTAHRSIDLCAITVWIRREGKQQGINMSASYHECAHDHMRVWFNNEKVV